MECATQNHQPLSSLETLFKSIFPFCGTLPLSLFFSFFPTSNTELSGDIQYISGSGVPSAFYGLVNIPKMYNSPKVIINRALHGSLTCLPSVATMPPHLDELDSNVI